MQDDTLLFNPNYFFINIYIYIYSTIKNIVCLCMYKHIYSPIYLLKYRFEVSPTRKRRTTHIIIYNVNPSSEKCRRISSDNCIYVVDRSRVQHHMNSVHPELMFVAITDLNPNCKIKPTTSCSHNNHPILQMICLRLYAALIFLPVTHIMYTNRMHKVLGYCPCIA